MIHIDVSSYLREPHINSGEGATRECSVLPRREGSFG